MSSVASLHRYPVKSMQGESVEAAEVNEHGIVGDRAYALVDVESQRIASCHHPAKWGDLLRCRARWDGPQVAIDLPDGTVVTTDGAGEERLSELCGRAVRFVRHAPDGARYELVVADVEDSWPAEVLTRLLGDSRPAAGRVARLGLGGSAPPGSLMDVAPVHVVTTSSLAALAGVGGDPDVRRFRANVVVDTGAAPEFSESAWTGRSVRAGGVELCVVAPTMRCLVPTLAQRGVDPHRETLVALTQHNRVESGPGRWASFGAYATTSTPGRIAVGDGLVLV